MEYEKHIKRLVLGYLKNECKHAYKVFLKYGFQNQHKHIPTRVAGQTLEDILRVYSRIQEIVQGHLEETDYYKERNVAFSAPNHLDDQLLYLLDNGAPSVSSTPCPRSPGESSIAETHQGNEVHRNNLSDVETTPEHTLPGNISLPNTSYQEKNYPRRKSESTSFTNTSVEKLPSTNRDAASEALTLKIPDKTDLYNKIGTNINTPECISFPQRGDNDKNKGVGEELDYMLQDFLSTPMTNTIGKVVGTESIASTSSSYTTHDSSVSRSLDRIDEQNNKAISSLLTTVNVPGGKQQSTTTDNVVNSETSQSFNTQSMSTQQHMYTPTFAGAQCVMQSSGGARYLLPQSTNQQYYIVNQPVVIPQSNQVMQLIQPVTPHKSLANRKNALTKDSMQMTEQDIMAMPTIILNERNEITYADPGGLPSNTPFRLNEANNIKEYLNLYGAYDRSPIVKLKPPKKADTLKPVKPTPTIKVEIYQRNTTLDTETLEKNPSNVCKSQDAPKKRSTTCLPNLNETIHETTDKELVVEVVDSEVALKCTAVATNESNDNSKDTAGLKIVDGACTPSPFKSAVRKPTPKSGSHVRNLTFPSPIRKTSEKPEVRRNSPRIKNKQQATKDLFGEEIEKEIEPKKVVSPKKKSKGSNNAVAKKSPVKTPKSCKKGKASKKATRKEIKEARLKEVEEELNTKDSWDSNLRKLIVPAVEEKDTTPVRRTSSRKRTRPSTELDVTDPDGKKLEESLKTPENVAKKRKTPNRKKAVKASNTQKSEDDNSKPQDENTASETKVLSPSKLNANKRNILPNDVDDVTPNNFKDTTQYPVTSKTRRNINNLLETPLKEDLVPPTPGTNPNTTETPFTPMLRANLKDFTEGDTFSINTPNFPVTPGLAALVNTSAAYYILSENESNKVTEATVLQEEKKSSERKSDVEEVELSPRVYGSRDILQNFNKCLVGKKNLELLDKDGVIWDGSSDKEEKSDSENVSEDESNNTVIQKGKPDQSKDGKGSLTRSRIPGKCMAVLESHLLPDSKDQMKSPEDSIDISEKQPTPELTPSLQAQQDEGQSTKEESRRNKTITQSSSSDSEILSKKVYEKRKSGDLTKTKVASSSITLETHSETEIEVMKKLGETNPETDRIINSTGEDKCSNSTEDDIRRTISEVCLESNPGFRASGYSLKEQLEEKKRKFIEIDKAQTCSAVVRKKPVRRSSVKPQPKISPRRQRKPSSPKRVNPSDEDKEESENEANVKNVRKNTRSQKQGAKNEGATDLIGVDSQDEFFKQSGTNLHRKHKEDLRATKNDSEQKKDVGENVTERVPTKRSVRASSASKLKKLQDVEEEEEEENESKCLNELAPVVETRISENIPTQTDPGRDVSTQSDDDPDEFDQTWDTWDFRNFESEDVLVHHDESAEPNKEPKVYDLSRLNKRIQTSMSCSDGMEATVILSVCPFHTLLELKPSEDCEHTDSSRDEPDGLFDKSKVVQDAASDSENAETKADDVDDFKCPKKRKHRSDSTGSNSSNKRNKLLETCLNPNNIGKLLDKLYGPS